MAISNQNTKSFGSSHSNVHSFFICQESDISMLVRPNHRNDYYLFLSSLKAINSWDFNLFLLQDSDFPFLQLFPDFIYLGTVWGYNANMFFVYTCLEQFKNYLDDQVNLTEVVFWFCYLLVNFNCFIHQGTCCIYMH